MTFTPKRDTTERLADTLVDGDLSDQSVAHAIVAVLRAYLADVPVNVEQPSLLGDPQLTRAIFPGIPARDALLALVKEAGGKLEVQDDGSLLIRPERPAEIVARQKAVALGQMEMYGLDRDGDELHVGDRATVAHQDDLDFQWLVGLTGVVEWIEATSVVLVLNDPRSKKLVTFLAWVRKVNPHGWQS